MNLLPLFVGVVFAAALQVSMGWWLDSGPGVVTTIAALFVVGVIFAADTRKARDLWIGVMVGMVAALVWRGPGTIWPIVIVVAGVLTGVTIAAAWAARRLFAR